MCNSSIKVLVAAHKKFNIPKNGIYIPIHVGRELSYDLGYIGDNTGDNISTKNPFYCELTALYWAWKNMDCEIIGLNHYRRYFTTKSLFSQYFREDFNNFILNEKTIYTILENVDVILPKKRNYYIENIWSHYKNAHNIEDLKKTREIIEELYPDYITSFDKIMNGRKLHLYNMFIMRKEYFDSYCEWLFEILFELEKRIDISDYDNYQKRVFGFISERLFNVWLENKNLRISEVRVINTEGINWMKKIYSFTKRKIKGIKNKD